MEFLPALRMFAVLTLLTGILYPLAVTGISQAAFSYQANGSVIMVDGQAVGSELIAQKFTHPAYFWPRPSAGDFGTVSSGVSNKGPTSKDLQATIKERADALRKTHGLSAKAPVPDELVTTSGSGLDPHLSPAGAEFQAERVATARQLSLQTVQALIRDNTEARQLGILGEPRVNVLKLNLALNQLPGQKAPQPIPTATPEAEEKG